MKLGAINRIIFNKIVENKKNIFLRKIFIS